MANTSAAAYSVPDRKVAAAVSGSQAGSMSRRGASSVIPLPNRAVESRDETFRFGPFQVLPYQKKLLDRDASVRLGSRAFDVLIALLERPGELVSKDELIARVWPGTTVDEGNLRVHVTALRKALRDQDETHRIICTIPGRGYRFTAPVSCSERNPSPEPVVDEVPSSTDLPISHTRMFGRAEFIRSLIGQLPEHRIITIVGPGGVGKTKVAMATAEALAESYSHGVRFVDLASVVEPARVPALLGNALGIEIRRENAISDLISFLGNKQMLIVMDNCEHVVEATALLIEKLSAGTSAVHILATSREPLRNSGERLRRLPPLRYPPASEQLTAMEALTYPAVQLFVDRIPAGDSALGLNDNNARAIAEICRRLDGLPLALELAAGRVDVFGIKGVAAQLDQPLRLLSCGRRTANTRHQTLAGMLDWSYQLLSESERSALRRLSIFPGEFTLPDACAVAADVGSDHRNTDDNIANLVSKSLIVADVSEEVVRYRLLDTTRAYAFGKLAASGELDAVARRHTQRLSFGRIVAGVG